jgi:predicted transcriptional regulator
LDARFAALAPRARRAIIAHLAKGEATVTELARPFTMSQPAITKHLVVLERAGLITHSRDAQRRPCRLHPRPSRMSPTGRRATWEFWAESYDRLDEYLGELQRKERKHGRKK